VGSAGALASNPHRSIVGDQYYGPDSEADRPVSSEASNEEEESSLSHHEDSAVAENTRPKYQREYSSFGNDAVTGMFSMASGAKTSNRSVTLDDINESDESDEFVMSNVTEESNVSEESDESIKLDVTYESDESIKLDVTYESDESIKLDVTYESDEPVVPAETNEPVIETNEQDMPVVLRGQFDDSTMLKLAHAFKQVLADLPANRPVSPASESETPEVRDFRQANFTGFPQDPAVFESIMLGNAESSESFDKLGEPSSEEFVDLTEELKPTNLTVESVDHSEESADHSEESEPVDLTAESVDLADELKPINLTAEPVDLTEELTDNSEEPKLLTVESKPAENEASTDDIEVIELSTTEEKSSPATVKSSSLNAELIKVIANELLMLVSASVVPNVPSSSMKELLCDESIVEALREFLRYPLLKPFDYLSQMFRLQQLCVDTLAKDIASMRECLDRRLISVATANDLFDLAQHIVAYRRLLQAVEIFATSRNGTVTYVEMGPCVLSTVHSYLGKMDSCREFYDAFCACSPAGKAVAFGKFSKAHSGDLFRRAGIVSKCLVRSMRRTADVLGDLAVPDDVKEAYEALLKCSDSDFDSLVNSLVVVLVKHFSGLSKRVNASG